MKIYVISTINGYSYIVEYNGSIDEIRSCQERSIYMTFVAMDKSGKYNVSIKCEYIVSIVEV